ncbi:DNA lyase [Candidatus Pacearchaeota archaeon]|nr:DNA lyase [Candidatus Pacearchaeota archaeon]
MELHSIYEKKKLDIQKRLQDFKNLSEDKYMEEFLFCLLTPQSNAQKCWQAVQQLLNLQVKSKEAIANILESKTRFHNNKSNYIIEGLKVWPEIKSMLSLADRKELRNKLAERIKGYGLKEAGHFLRNIGKSDNRIAILDRHILRNLKSLNVIGEDKIRNAKHYHELESKFLEFSESVKIPIDELDLLFWSKENGEIFK